MAIDFDFDFDFDEEQRRKIGTERIGTSLLQGMVMTDRICSVPDCNMITMRSKDKTITDLCLLCTHDQPIPPVSTKTKTEVVESEIPVSQLIGKKLLEGWTMMGECCSNCKVVPLMRSKDMKLFCVKCNKFQIEPIQEGPKGSNPKKILQDDEIQVQVQVPKGEKTEMNDTISSLDFSKKYFVGQVESFTIKVRELHPTK